LHILNARVATVARAFFMLFGLYVNSNPTTIETISVSIYRMPDAHMLVGWPFVWAAKGRGD
jgi:hypothetical protein